jgi:hypothetical protein
MIRERGRRWEREAGIKAMFAPESPEKVRRSERGRSRWFLVDALVGHSATTGIRLLQITLARPTMGPANISQLTQRLPLELLEKVLTYTSIPDILRMKQVGRLCDRIQRFQLNVVDIFSFARLLVVSTISSKNRLTSSTEPTSMLQGLRITPT